MLTMCLLEKSKSTLIVVDNKTTFGKSLKLSEHNPGHSQMQADIWNGPTGRALQEFRRFFPPFTSLSAGCFFLQDFEKHRVAFLQLGLGLAVYCYTHKIMVLINPFQHPFILWSFPFIQGALLQSDMSGTRGQEQVWIHPVLVGSEMPLILPAGMSSDGSWEPAAAQLHWVLTTNDLIPSINKA